MLSGNMQEKDNILFSESIQIQNIIVYRKHFHLNKNKCNKYIGNFCLELGIIW